MDEELTENKENEHVNALESSETDYKPDLEFELNRVDIKSCIVIKFNSCVIGKFSVLEGPRKFIAIVCDNFPEICIKGCIEKRHTLFKENHILQQRLATYISGSSDKDYFLKLNFTEEADEWDFTKLLENITATEEDLQHVSDKWLEEKESLKQIIKEKREYLKELEAKFVETLEKTALNSVNSKTGERLSRKDVEALIAQEKQASQTLQEFQLHSIQKRHYFNLAMKDKKNLAEGPVDFAEYEMMCIETQNNKEIIQPMFEEIKNIMKRASNVINILSHLGQKLDLAKKEKANAESSEKKLEVELNEMRNLLFEEKMKYTRMKHENKELQHKFMLLQYPRLIEDYNEVQQNNEEAKKELQRLKTVYNEEMKILNKRIKDKF